ncbi:MAG TPA: sialidase family protein [Ohtaekwangia sp.]|uniref:sialidase family protein n=1 Tax=Ohtaekwangia sp. TaxID=2066019 RepID=UPI002F93DD43
MNKVIAAFFLLSISIHVTGQIKNTTIAGLAGAPVRASIAINPKDIQLSTAAAGNIVYYSTNGGETWQKSAAVFKEGSNAVLVSDSKGNLYYLLQATEGGVNRIWCYTSDDGGQQWDGGNAINAESTKDQVNPNVSLTDKNDLYVTYTQFDKFGNADPNCLSTIQLTKSSNGKKWDKSMELSQTPGNCIDDRNTAIGPMAIESPDGKEYCIWSNQSKIFMDRSFDGRQWLTNDIAIARQSESCDEEVAGSKRCFTPPVFVVDRNKNGSRGTLYITWSDLLQHDTDVWFLRSHNYGDNWSSLLKVNEDIPDVHQYNPWMTIDHATGYIYILYFARNGDEDTDVYLAHSVDGGSNFKNIKISETPFKSNNNAGVSGYITVNKGVIVAAWTRWDNGKASLLTATVKQEELVPVNSAKPVGKK